MPTKVPARMGFLTVAFGLACLLAGMACEAADAQPAPPAQRPDVSPRVWAFVKPMEEAESDDELTKKLKERHNVAASLLEARVEEYKRGVIQLALVLEAARLVVEAKLDLAQDDAARLAVFEDALEVAKLIEGHQQGMFDAGVGSKSEFLRARLARVAIEVQILKAKQAQQP